METYLGLNLILEKIDIWKLSTHYLNKLHRMKGEKVDFVKYAIKLTKQIKLTYM